METKPEVKKRVKFTQEQRQEIFKLLDAGELLHREIAEKYNVKRQRITELAKIKREAEKFYK
jgi:predicted DNA-binding protein YlxM (UPF0122 family)